MNKIKLLKFLGMVAALLTGGVMIASGDAINGIGVIAASLSSASLVANAPE